MNLPDKIKTGDKRNVIFSRFNDLLDYVRSLDIKGDNRTIFLSKTPSGILIRGKEQGGGGIKSSASTGYNGEFKVVASEDQIKVINGASPDSIYCGYTDIAGQRAVQSFSIDSATGKKIYLIGWANEGAWVYHVTIYLEGNEPAADFKSDPIELASIDSDGNVTQSWTGGSIKFSETYLT